MGSLISVTLQFPNFDFYGKELKGYVKYFIASVYHPDAPENYRNFDDIPTTTVSKKTARTILGQDVNANIEISGKDDKKINNAIGSHGIDNRSQKGVWALQWLSMIRPRATNTFFKHKDYTTHTSFFSTQAPTNA